MSSIVSRGTHNRWTRCTNIIDPGVLDAGSSERADGERGSLCYGDDGVWKCLCEAEGKASWARDAVAHVAFVARLFGRGLVFHEAASLYEAGGDGGLAHVGRAQFGVGFESSEGGLGEREGL